MASVRLSVAKFAAQERRTRKETASAVEEVRPRTSNRLCPRHVAFVRHPQKVAATTGLAPAVWLKSAEALAPLRARRGRAGNQE
jgi:hypothetical protein